LVNRTEASAALRFKRCLVCQRHTLTSIHIFSYSLYKAAAQLHCTQSKRTLGCLEAVDISGLTQHLIDFTNVESFELDVGAREFFQ
jgi:hypothetical protein